MNNASLAVSLNYNLILFSWLSRAETWLQLNNRNGLKIAKLEFEKSILHMQI